MSTRSEIRIYQNKKLKGCVYHHSDGYPSHIIEDIHAMGYSKHPKSVLKNLSKNHGTQNVQCSYGDKSEKHQGDIEYSYKIMYTKDKSKFAYPELEKVKIFKHPFNGRAKKIFEGSISKAHEEFVCKEGLE